MILDHLPPVRPTPRGSRARTSLRLPAFWLVAGLLAFGAYRLLVILRPAAVKYPIATTAAILLFALYAVPFVLVVAGLDYLEREPPLLLATAAAWGGLVATTTALPADVALQQMLAKLNSPAFAASWGPAFAAPTVEEPLKLLGVVAVVLVARAQLNSVVDGLVYGAFAGLGFQVVEDILYAVNAVDLAGRGDRLGPVVVTLLLRGFLAGIWTHTLFSALSGAGVAYLMLYRDRPLWTHRLPVAAGALLGAWAFHFLLNSPWLAEGFGYGALGVLAALLLKAIPAVLMIVLLVRSTVRREANYYAGTIAALGDPRLATERELAALGSMRARSAARRYASVQQGRACGRAVRRLQRAQAMLAVELSRGGDKVERHRAELLAVRTRLIAWQHPDAYAPPGDGTPWFVWMAGAAAAGLGAVVLAVVIRALGGG